MGFYECVIVFVVDCVFADKSTSSQSLDWIFTNVHEEIYY